jgi:hypothetical protein
MSLKTFAQQFIVVDPNQMQDQSLVPLEVHEPVAEPLDVVDPHPGLVHIVLTDLPGAPDGTPEPEEDLEIVDEIEEQPEDENDAKSKKNDKWDWGSKGAEGFLVWIKERVDDVPRHSGQDSAGLERAISYLERLDNEISKAMRLDLDGELDANKIESVRATIDDGLSRLHERLDKVKKKSKSRRKKKAEFSSEMIKSAQKITGVQGVFVTVDLLTSRIARVCINGMVSAGHDIEDLYKRQVSKYKLNDREQAQVMQLLADMGYPLRQDRGYLADEDVDATSSDNFDWAANYRS